MSPINQHSNRKGSQSSECHSPGCHILDKTDLMVKVRMNEIADLLHRSIQTFDWKYQSDCQKLKGPIYPVDFKVNSQTGKYQRNERLCNDGVFGCEKQEKSFDCVLDTFYSANNKSGHGLNGLISGEFRYKSGIVVRSIRSFDKLLDWEINPPQWKKDSIFRTLSSAVISPSGQLVCIIWVEWISAFLRSEKDILSETFRKNKSTGVACAWVIV